MSRYTVECAHEGIEIVVGWDPPLRSLFAQVSDRRVSDAESHPMLLWGDFASIDELARAIAAWSELPSEVRVRLAIECGEARRPSSERRPAFERPERVVFSGLRCLVVQADYPNGGIALQLFEDTDERIPFATATVCVPGSGINEREQALVRESEECEGMLEALATAGIVRPTGRRVKSGFIELVVVDVLPAGVTRS